jgi:hypothetical protein
MHDREIDAALSAAERELAGGRVPDLGAIGFWRAVSAVKRAPDLVARHAERIAHIDRAAFRRRVRLVFPATLGVVLVVGGLVVDLLFLVVAAGQMRPWREILLLVGAAGLDIAVHGVAHLVVGTAVGIRFTDWFIDLPKRPQPGFKIDYASYLRTPPRSRAWMHASGAIATKLTPFVVLPYAVAIGADQWAVAVLAAVGVLQIVSDATLSVKSSDWKKFRREWRYAKRSARAG